jgi:pleiotropic regulator 1
MSTAYTLPPLDPLLRSCAKRTRDIFASCPDDGIKEDEKRCVTSSGMPSTFTEEISSARIRLSVKINDEYRDFKELPPALLAQQGPIGPARPKEQRKAITAGRRLLVLLKFD